MAIITENTNSNPMQQTISADGFVTETITFPKEVPQVNFCPCDYECDYVNNVFADPLNTTEYRNDKSSFLIALSSSSATLEINILKNGVPFLVNDDSYGQYFPKGTFNNTDNQINYVGFVADWLKIYNTLGFGEYVFQFKESVFNREFITESFKFKLSLFNEIQANKTLKFKFIQNGIIEDGLDYTGLNWSTELRVKAKLKYLAPTLTVDNYQTSQRVVSQIQDKTIKNFEVETELIPSVVGDLFTESGVIANDVLITNYDFFAYKSFTDLNVIFTEISDFKGNYRTNSKASFIFTLEERKQDTVKRNVNY
jgi:hypothetical protein